MGARRSLLLALSAAAQLGLASRPVSSVHLALTRVAGTMRVGWTTAQGDVLGNGTSEVQWGWSPHALSQSAWGTNWSWVDVANPSGLNRTYTHHLATMTGLDPGVTVYYRVGDALDGWSSVSSFVAPRDDYGLPGAAPLRVAVFGDMGWTNAQALPYLQTLAAGGDVDLMLDLGDYAYNLDYRDGQVGDAFQSSIEPITSTVPLLGCVGNHEVRRVGGRAGAHSV